MGFDKEINLVIQQVKGVLFDVVSEIQGVIASLEKSLSSTHKDEEQKQIRTLISQLENQLSLILTNTSALADSILGYKKLLNNTIFSSEDAEVANDEPTKTAGLSGNKIIKSSMDLLKNNAINGNAVEAVNVSEKEKTEVEKPVVEESKVSSSEEEKLVIDQSVIDAVKAVNIPEKEVSVAEQPVNEAAKDNSSEEVKPVVAEATVTEKKEPVAEQPVNEAAKDNSSEEVKPVVAEATVTEKNEPVAEQTVIEAAKDNSSEEVKPVVAEATVTEKKEPVAEQPVNEAAKDSSSEEVKPVVAEATVTEKKEPVAEQPVNEAAKDNSSEEVKPVVAEATVTEKNEPVAEQPVIEEAKNNSSETKISSDDVVIESKAGSESIDESNSFDFDSLLPFRIGDEKLDKETTLESPVASLGEDIPGEIVFLAGLVVPKVIVVTLEQLKKLKNSCKSQAEKLNFETEVTSENLEELMSNLPSLYEINPEEAERLSEKITAKLQELEAKDE